MNGGISIFLKIAINGVEDIELAIIPSTVFFAESRLETILCIGYIEYTCIVARSPLLLPLSMLLAPCCRAPKLAVGVLCVTFILCDKILCSRRCC